MTSYDLGFRIGPRINAAGRIDAARAVVELFDTRDRDEAKRLAEHLEARNHERREVQQQIVELAIAEFEGGGRSAFACGSHCWRGLASRSDRYRSVENRGDASIALVWCFPSKAMWPTVQVAALNLIIC